LSPIFTNTTPLPYAMSVDYLHTDKLSTVASFVLLCLLSVR